MSIVTKHSFICERYYFYVFISGDLTGLCLYITECTAGFPGLSFLFLKAHVLCLVLLFQSLGLRDLTKFYFLRFLFTLKCLFFQQY